MRFFYIRHGDPIYEPDSLTPLGERQAEALAKRLAQYGIDKIYASTSNRAIMTAKPTSEILKKDIELLDFANECYTFEEFTTIKNGQKIWFFSDSETRRLLADESVASVGQNWYEHPKLSAYKKGIERVHKETFEFFKSLGYEKIGNTSIYKAIKPNEEKVALFAHAGFGVAFLSEVLGIPYPIIANIFDIDHTGMTVIDFNEEEGYAIPKVLTWSSDSHIYKEGLPTKY